MRAEPARQFIEVGIAHGADGRAHLRHVAATVAVLLERVAQVIQFLPGQIGHARNLCHAGFTMAGRAQAQPHGLGGRCRVRWRKQPPRQHGDGQAAGKRCSTAGRQDHDKDPGSKSADSSSHRKARRGRHAVDAARAAAAPATIARLITGPFRAVSPVFPSWRARSAFQERKTVPTTLLQSNLPGLDLIHRGKVRDVYALPENRLLIVASDRLSAFDVVLPDPIPGKGEMLTQISNFWFAKTAHLVPNHLLDVPLADVLPAGTDLKLYEKRAVVTRRLKPVPVEAIARGYIIGSGWKDYQATGSLCGIKLQAGLKQAQQLPEPIFTPSTKAAVGDHDENVSFDAVVAAVGPELAEQVREATLTIYKWAAAYAAERGIIIADTKFEFGTDEDGKLYVMDEMLTPDSSRFWPADSYQVGISPPSYDKQFVRDYLETLDWNKKAPGPNVPADVIAATAAKYAEALQRLANITVD